MFFEVWLEEVGGLEENAGRQGGYMAAVLAGPFANICRIEKVFLYMRCGAAKGSRSAEEYFLPGFRISFFPLFHPAREGRGVLCTTQRRGEMRLRPSDSPLPGCGVEQV